MKSSVCIWAISALTVITLPFNPVLNRPPLALIVFLVAVVVGLIALDRAIHHDMSSTNPKDGQ